MRAGSCIYGGYRRVGGGGGKNNKEKKRRRREDEGGLGRVIYDDYYYYSRVRGVNKYAGNTIELSGARKRNGDGGDVDPGGPVPGEKTHRLRR